MMGTQTTQKDLQTTYLILTLLSEFSKAADAKSIYQNQLYFSILTMAYTKIL